MLRDLVLKNRTHRRFFENHPVSREALVELVDLARMSPSGGNLQPLKYLLSCDAATNAKIFPHLVWAAYLKDWKGPVEGERPSAYIIILNDKNVSAGAGCDHGIAAQTIMLGATEKGLRGCMLGSVNRNALKKVFSLGEHLDILLVLALGQPKETVSVEAVGPSGDIKYWRDAEGVHHVPKRSLADVVLNIE